MTMYHSKVLIAVFVLSFAALAVLVPVYTACLGSHKPYKMKKMVCSSLFMLCAVCAVMYRGGFSAYSTLMLCGLALSWLGDLFLAVRMKGLMFVLGLGSFLLAHICFTASCTVSVAALTGGFGIKIYEPLIVVLMLGLCFLVKRKTGLKLGNMGIPVLVYAAVISCMLARTVRLAVVCAANGSAAAGALMLIAALSFTVSDSVLVFIIFKNVHSTGTEGANLVSYYLAQVLFAASIFRLG